MSHAVTIFYFSFRISLESTPSIWTFAKQENIAELQNACLLVTQSHIDEFTSDRNFLASLELEEIIRVLTGSNLRPNSEETVFRAIEAWLAPRIDQDVEGDITRLLTCLNPTHLSTAFVENVVMKNNLYTTSAAFR